VYKIQNETELKYRHAGNSRNKGVRNKEIVTV